MTTPTGTDNPFNWNVDDSGSVDVPTRLTESPTETYDFDYDFGGTADDPLNSPVEQAREDARDVVDGNGLDSAGLGAVALIVGVFAAFIAILGGN